GAGRFGASRRNEGGVDERQAVEIPYFFEAPRLYKILFSSTARGKEALPILLCNGCPSAPPHQRWSDRYDCERSSSKIAHPLCAASRSACQRRRPWRDRAAWRRRTSPAADHPIPSLAHLCPACP